MVSLSSLKIGKDARINKSSMYREKIVTMLAPGKSYPASFPIENLLINQI